MYLTVLRRVEVTGSGVTRLLERESPGPSSAPCPAPCRSLSRGLGSTSALPSSSRGLDTDCTRLLAPPMCRVDTCSGHWLARVKEQFSSIGRLSKKSV